MGGIPFGLWRFARGGDEHAVAVTRPLAGDWRDAFAVLYRECALVLRMGPREVDTHEIWEIAAALGRNESDQQREPWPSDAPDIRVVRRSLCYSKDIPYDRDAPISDEEYVELLALAKSGKRQAV